MVYQRDYVVQLRVYEPLVAHPEYEDFPVSDNRAKIEDLLAADADSRLTSFPIDPIADSYRATPIFLSAETSGDGIDRVCPAQDDIRSWHAFDALAENLSRTELELLVPKQARKKAHAQRVEWMEGEPDTRVFTRTAMWDVPPVWWLAIAPGEDSEDVIAESTAEATHSASVSEFLDGRRRLIRVPVFTASARVEWAYEIMKDKSRLVAMVESTEAFMDWLNTFDVNSVLELDLGGMSTVIDAEAAAQTVADWIDGLDTDDYEQAVAAFGDYSRMWESTALYARSS